MSSLKECLRRGDVIHIIGLNEFLMAGSSTRVPLTLLPKERYMRNTLTCLMRNLLSLVFVLNGRTILAFSPSRGRSSTVSSLYVSIGLGPEENKSEEKELVAGVDYEIPNHEEYRTSRRSAFDERCDNWFADLLEGPDGCMGSLATEARTKLETPVELVNEVELPTDDELWTPYVNTKLPWTPLTPAYGLEQFGLPIPRRNAETWRHFDVNGMISESYKESTTQFVLSEDQVATYQGKLEKSGAWLDDDACEGRLVYIDGSFIPELSKSTDMVQNVANIDGLDELSRQQLGRLTDGFTDELAAPVPNNDIEETSYSMLSRPNHNPGAATTQFAINTQQGTACFAALNTCKTQNVAMVRAPSGYNKDLHENVSAKPILIVQAISHNGSSKDSSGVSIHPRVLVQVEDDARTSVVQSCVDLESGTFAPKLFNGYTQVFIGENANLTHAYLEESGGMVTGGVEVSDDQVKEGPKPREIESQRSQLKDTHLEAIDVHVTGENGAYEGIIMSVGGSGRVRIAHSIALLKTGAHAGVKGFSLSGGAQRTDVKTNIHHVAQGTTSNQLQKNMIGGRATGSFRGRIRVEQSAQQTDSQQLSRTILLSDKARAWSVPSLEIIADDVQCTHGATVSDLSEEELFYLRSRGLDQITARNMLMYAFSGDISDTIHPSVLGELDGTTGLRHRVIERLENVVPQGERAVRGEFQSV